MYTPFTRSRWHDKRRCSALSLAVSLPGCSKRARPSEATLSRWLRISAAGPAQRHRETVRYRTRDSRQRRIRRTAFPLTSRIARSGLSRMKRCRTSSLQHRSFFLAGKGIFSMEILSAGCMTVAAVRHNGAEDTEKALLTLSRGSPCSMTRKKAWNMLHRRKNFSSRLSLR